MARGWATKEENRAGAWAAILPCAKASRAATGGRGERASAASHRLIPVPRPRPQPALPSDHSHSAAVSPRHRRVLVSCSSRTPHPHPRYPRFPALAVPLPPIPSPVQHVSRVELKTTTASTIQSAGGEWHKARGQCRSHQNPPPRHAQVRPHGCATYSVTVR